jgi:hypothetical protein
MQFVTPQKKTAARALESKFAAVLQTTKTDWIGSGDPTPELSRVEALRRSFPAIGFSLHQLCGDEIGICGPGLPGAALPDLRGATILLRELSRGTA